MKDVTIRDLEGGMLRSSPLSYARVSAGGMISNGN
jgi:hypothetical protein